MGCNGMGILGARQSEMVCTGNGIGGVTSTFGGREDPQRNLAALREPWLWGCAVPRRLFSLLIFIIFVMI